MSVPEARRLKDLESGNAKLKKLLAEVAARSKCRAGPHQATQPLAERLRWKLQRQAARRVPEQGMVWQPAGSKTGHWEMAAFL